MNGRLSNIRKTEGDRRAERITPVKPPTLGVPQHAESALKTWKLFVIETHFHIVTM